MPRHESWWRAQWRAGAAECCGTALLVALGCASMVTPGAGGAGGGGVPLTHPAIAFGAAVTLLASALGGVSGAHLNPAVTAAALVAGRLPAGAGALYAAAQCAGAVAGLALLRTTGEVGRYTCTMPADGAVGAAVTEALLTGALCLLLCALWRQHDAAAPDRAAPLKVGLAVAGLVYSGGAISGASLNPARSLAPALLFGCWEHHWVYWAGPVSGAVLAALLHRALDPAAAPGDPRSAPSDPRHPRDPRASHEQLPLSDKGEP